MEEGAKILTNVNITDIRVAQEICGTDFSNPVWTALPQK